MGWDGMAACLGIAVGRGWDVGGLTTSTGLLEVCSMSRSQQNTQHVHQYLCRTIEKEESFLKRTLSHPCSI